MSERSFHCNNENGAFMIFFIATLLEEDEDDEENAGDAETTR